MNKLSLACLAILVITGSAYLGYWYGNRQGIEKGHQAALVSNDDNYQNALSSIVNNPYSPVVVEYEKLRTDYNQLAEDYNTLRNQAVQYVTVPAPRQPITCTSSTLGTYSPTTTTRCY